MSLHALKVYSEVRVTQAVKNEARHIRTKINEARGSPHDAAVRWPFELLQNALDAGPRTDGDGVEVTLKHEQGGFVFEHNGAFFKVQDLAALLSGGSSKEFDNIETTGRFGTGFLVTHVLAPRVRLAGLLDAGSEIEQFDLVLDRAGDEDEIVRNIEHCNDAIERAAVISDVGGVPSARFIYDRDDVASLREGLETFRQALPYLFVTCPLLGSVRLELDGEIYETWKAGALNSRAFGNAIVQERVVRIIERGIEYRSVRVSLSETGAGAAVAALEQTASGYRFLVPPLNFPRVFCRYPIRTSSFLPINAVLDGRFDLDQERRKVLLAKDEMKVLFHAALGAVLPLVELAWTESWELRHHLARVEPSQGAFSDEGTERDWINSELRVLADALAKMSLVETMQGVGPAASDSGSDWFADFIWPRLSRKSEADDTTIERMWGLVSDAANLYPPKKELAEDWSAIASGWATLGVNVTLVTLEDLARAVNTDVTHLDGLLVRCGHREWLARFIDCVGECWKRRAAVNKGLLDRLLPNQNGRLCSGSELNIGTEISEELKDLAEELGLSLRSRVLDEQLIGLLTGPEIIHGYEALREVVDTDLSEEDVIRTCIDHLKRTLPEGRTVSEAAHSVIAGSIRFLDFLWRTRAETGAQLARDVPLAAGDGKSIRVLATQRVMAPVRSWRSEARPFSEIYPPNLVLVDDYSGDGAKVPNVVGPLLAWGIAYAEPLVSQSIGGGDLKADRVKALLVDCAVDPQNLALAQTNFSQIALLPQILPRCVDSSELAVSLLGLILVYVAPNDPEWETTRIVAARRGSDSVQVGIRPALWLGDILTRPWIPIAGEDRRVVVPDHHVVRPMLRAEWYAENEPAIRLLSRFFGFGALELRLASVASDERLREKISDELARVVTLFGGDLYRYGQLAAQLEAQEIAQQRRDRFLNLGRAVQDAVGATLTALGLNVALIDCGYDFEVLDADVDDSSYKFEVESVLVEVKATTTDRVRMTPKQATTAANGSEKYVLCVVDLRGVPDQRLDQPWSNDDILKLARITLDVGAKVRNTWYLVEQARLGTVSISGDGLLRYDVPASVWGQGCDIAEWLLATWGKAVA